MKKFLRKFRPSVARLEGRMLLDSATGATASQATGTVPIVSAPASAPGGSDLLLVVNNADFHLGLITTPPAPAPAAGGSDPLAALLTVNNGSPGLGLITTPPAPAPAPGPGTQPVPAMGQRPVPTGSGPVATNGSTPNPGPIGAGTQGAGATAGADATAGILATDHGPHHGCHPCHEGRRHPWIARPSVVDTAIHDVRRGERSCSRGA
jgi:hypothetical protein